MSLIAFAYYGGKQRLLPSLLPMLEARYHESFVDLFGGSAAVILNKTPVPIETYNDINGEACNFFRVLRQTPQALIDALLLTPYARQEFELAWIPTDDPVEQARRFFLRVQMDVAKAGRRSDKSWSVNKRYSPGEHSSAVKNFMDKIPGLEAVAARLRSVQMENMDCLKVIAKYDTWQTLFYADPPYMPATRTSKKDYKHEMSIEQHEALAAALMSISGKFLISGYDSPQYNDWFSSCYKHCFPAKVVPMSRGAGRVTQECVWANFDPTVPTGQLPIFYEYKH